MRQCWTPNPVAPSARGHRGSSELGKRLVSFSRRAWVCEAEQPETPGRPASHFSVEQGRPETTGRLAYHLFVFLSGGLPLLLITDAEGIKTYPPPWGTGSKQAGDMAIDNTRTTFTCAHTQTHTFSSAHQLGSRDALPWQCPGDHVANTTDSPTPLPRV